MICQKQFQDTRFAPFSFLEIDQALLLMTIVAFQFREIRKKEEQKWLFWRKEERC